MGRGWIMIIAGTIGDGTDFREEGRDEFEVHGNGYRRTRIRQDWMGMYAICRANAALYIR
jgi:hypothetical protein